MKRCKIKTFQYAHNYGALLQCYALKKYISSLGIETFIDRYIPKREKGAYDLTIHISVRHPRSTYSSIRRYLKRKNQYGIFKTFIDELLGDDKADIADVIILGSDQIWNEKITGETEHYYKSENDKADIVAYAGSFGATSLTEFQKQMVSKHFSKYKAISVREKCNATEVAMLCKKPVEAVVDPVFLLDSEEWAALERRPHSLTSDNYIVYYSLKSDESLIRETIEYSKRMGCKVYAIHPICDKMYAEFTQLYDIGPREFVYLVHHAKLVSTNSFHAVSFSGIFEKDVLYKAFSDTESRVPTIMGYYGLDIKRDSVQCYSFKNANTELIQNMIIQSKDYLKKNLNVSD